MDGSSTSEAGKGSGEGPASGPGKGKGASGSGRGVAGVSQFGWYNEMIHDRFLGAWEQPTSIVRSSQKFVSRLKIRIARDGTVLDRTIAISSGNTVMDESVLTAAQKVRQIDPLPSGLGGETYEVAIDFKLDQGE